jgi:hypothetical protein
MVDAARIADPYTQESRKVVTLRFDYGSVSSSVAQFLQGQAARIRRHQTNSIIHIGKALIGAKHYLSHGSFIVWVETEAGMSARTAQIYMRVAQWVSDKSTAAAHLAPTALHLLSAPGVPKDYVRDILNRVDAGERVAPAAIRRELRALRDAEQRKHHKEVSLLQLRDDSRETEMNAVLMDANDVVARAVTIMVRGLSSKDFEQVRVLLTSKPVLDDTKLGHHLATEFSRIEG